uniref:Uncharacterized protein n=1 Tax=Oryza meridionalis TaxID=40149 RepID=A0A0E0DAH8_9ORYZ
MRSTASRALLIGAGWEALKVLDFRTDTTERINKFEEEEEPQTVHRGNVIEEQEQLNEQRWHGGEDDDGAVAQKTWLTLTDASIPPAPLPDEVDGAAGCPCVGPTLSVPRFSFQEHGGSGREARMAMSPWCGRLTSAGTPPAPPPNEDDDVTRCPYAGSAPSVPRYPF